MWSHLLVETTRETTQRERETPCFWWENKRKKRNTPPASSLIWFWKKTREKTNLMILALSSERNNSSSTTAQITFPSSLSLRMLETEGVSKRILRSPNYIAIQHKRERRIKMRKTFRCVCSLDTLIFLAVNPDHNTWPLHDSYSHCLLFMMMLRPYVFGIKGIFSCCSSGFFLTLAWRLLDQVCSLLFDVLRASYPRNLPLIPVITAFSSREQKEGKRRALMTATSNKSSKGSILTIFWFPSSSSSSFKMHLSLLKFAISCKNILSTLYFSMPSSWSFWWW